MVDVDGESAIEIFKSGLPTRDVADMVTVCAYEVEFLATYLFVVADPGVLPEGLSTFEHHNLRSGEWQV